MSRSTRKAPINLLSQALGFSPGTSLIGQFGSTDARFKRIPLDNAPEPHNPGPGAYDNSPSPGGVSWGWGTGAAHHQNAPAPRDSTPGPGAYGTEAHPGGGLLSNLERRRPGKDSASAFGSNVKRSQPLSGTGTPGPGRYLVEESSIFLSSSNGARSPYVAAARARTGSRLQRELDSKATAVFASRRPAHVLASHASGASSEAISDGPGPTQYAPKAETISARQSRLLQQQGVRTSFDSTANRFRRDPMSGVPEPLNPGPGTHLVGRWNGVKDTQRRPRSQLVDKAGRCGFLSSNPRFDGLVPFSGGLKAARAQQDKVVAYLAAGALGPVGTATHTMEALKRIGRWDQAR